MTRSSRRRIAAAAVVVLLAIGAAAWWRVDLRTRPDSVGPRFTKALLERHPGTTIDRWEHGVMRIALPSGVYIDVQLRRLFDACTADRFACPSSLDRALDDVDDTDRATRDPRVAMIRPVIVGESVPGVTLGYVTEPFVGSLELRYALTIGVASTFVTSAIADRIALARPALKAAALAAQHAEPPATLEPLDDDRGASIFDVRSTGDAPALLLDRERMKQFATRLGTTRLYAAVPSRGTLYLVKADDAGAKSLAKRAGPSAYDLLSYDVDAPDGSAMTVARTR